MYINVRRFAGMYDRGSVGRKGEKMVYIYRDPILKFAHQGLMFQSVDSKTCSERGRFVAIKYTNRKLSNLYNVKLYSAITLHDPSVLIYNRSVIMIVAETSAILFNFQRTSTMVSPTLKCECEERGLDREANINVNDKLDFEREIVRQRGRRKLCCQTPSFIIHRRPTRLKYYERVRRSIWLNRGGANNPHERVTDVKMYRLYIRTIEAILGRAHAKERQGDAKLAYDNINIVSLIGT
ncbi:hypothetical protein PUN28_007342 [Cardiocondyla obscurior]|uniref:Uncharacterized protein n=1 Tax=Cardiocondyla obscurior TaxID=286306 RepID=A0AAW2G4I7_9HYME